MAFEQVQEDNVLLYEDGTEFERMNLFYEDDAVLPEVESLYDPGDSRQEKAEKVIAAVQEYLDSKDRIAVLYGLADSDWETDE